MTAGVNRPAKIRAGDFGLPPLSLRNNIVIMSEKGVMGKTFNGLVSLTIASFFFYPLVNEDTDSACLAFGRKAISAMANGEQKVGPDEAFLWDLIINLSVQQSGKVVEAFVQAFEKQRHPGLPIMLGCTLDYWDLLMQSQRTHERVVSRSPLPQSTNNPDRTPALQPPAPVPYGSGTDVHFPKLSDTFLYKNLTYDCRTVNLATWKHPTKQVLIRSQVHLDSLELCNADTYPIFHVRFQYDPMALTDSFFVPFYEAMFRANFQWPLAFVDTTDNETIIIRYDNGNITPSFEHYTQ